MEGSRRRAAVRIAVLESISIVSCEYFQSRFTEERRLLIINSVLEV